MRASGDDPRSWSPEQKLRYLRERNVGDCQRCPLAATRRRIVFGVGAADARLMLVGEAPGADEDRQGEPFVGRAGKLLDAWLAQVGLRRSDVYIANVLKCRPPNNRDPSPVETAKCSPFLRAQIRAVHPRVIVALGAHAARLLSGREASVGALRSAQLVYRDAERGDLEIPMLATYHPAFVLRAAGASRSAESPTPEYEQRTAQVLGDLRRACSIAGLT
jgi:DNA polymerase